MSVNSGMAGIRNFGFLFLNFFSAENATEKLKRNPQEMESQPNQRFMMNSGTRTKRQNVQKRKFRMETIHWSSRLKTINTLTNSKRLKQ